MSHDMDADLMEAIIEENAYPEQEAELVTWRRLFANTIGLNRERWKKDHGR